MVHDEFHGHFVLCPSGHYNICALHGGLYELVEGLYGGRGRGIHKLHRNAFQIFYNARINMLGLRNVTSTSNQCSVDRTRMCI